MATVIVTDLRLLSRSPVRSSRSYFEERQVAGAFPPRQNGVGVGASVHSRWG
jgi:hypothetical protein